ncbi:MAG: hypothetical protein Tsb0033_21720 [Winogradskyella sp.]
MLVVFATLFMAINCDNEPYEGEIIFEDTTCLEAIETTETAAENFLNAIPESYTLLCLTYREALLNQIDICGDEDGSLQIILEELSNCEAELDPCEEAIAQTELARITYESAADQTIEALCNNYKDALQYQIDVCGDDGTLQSIIEELGDCVPEVVDVVGTWKLVSWNTDELRDLDNDGIVTNNYLDDIDCYDNETIDFNADGTGTMFLRSIAEFTFTPTDDGEDFFTNCTDIIENKSFTWTETINSVTMLFTDGSSISLFKNGNLYTAIDDAFYAESTVDDSVITERITFVYNKL